LTSPLLSFLHTLLFYVWHSLTVGIMAMAEKHLSQDGEKVSNQAAMDEVRLEAALGHKQELVRNFSLWSLTSLGIVIAKYILLFFTAR
jgi:hypothetical protein